MSIALQFAEARAHVLSEEKARCGIGTLSEKILHKILKFYIDFDQAHHEIPVLGKVADVFDGNEIFEVQTRAFERLLPKLDKFLPAYKTTVILPLISSVNIHYIDKATGELVKNRRSSRHDGINRAACELYKIARHIPTPSLKVKILFIDFDEYRYFGIKGKGALIERIPTQIAYETVLTEPSDYRLFIPRELPAPFLASELSRAIKLDSRRTHNTLSLLMSLGILERERSGRAYLYNLTKTE